MGYLPSFDARKRDKANCVEGSFSQIRPYRVSESVDLAIRLVASGTIDRLPQ